MTEPKIGARPTLLPADRSVQPTPPPRGPHRSIDQIEAAWGDPILTSITRRLIESGWQPDPPTAYCAACGYNATPMGDCPHCTHLRLPFSRLVRLGTYAGLLRAWIREVKFEASVHAGRRLGEAMGTQLAARLGDSLQVRSGAIHRVVLVPVPTSWRRRVTRGIDHTQVITSSLARQLRRELSRASLAPRPIQVSIAHVLRKRHTPSQTKVAPSARAANAARAFRPVDVPTWLRSRLVPQTLTRMLEQFSPWRGLTAPGTLIVVVDDITTTGATLVQCCRAVKKGLKRRGNERPQVWACVAAATQPKASGRPGSP